MRELREDFGSGVGSVGGEGEESGGVEDYDLLEHVSILHQ